MFYMEVSAKTGHNVTESFYKMANEVHGKKSSREGSRERGARIGGSSTGSGLEESVMADRVKLRAPQSQAGVYAGANEVPTGLNDVKKKKCC